MIIVNIDGDLIAYPCAASAENDTVEIAIQRVDQQMRNIIEQTQSDHYNVYLSTSSNFRKQVCAEYKANRTDPPPKFLADCKEFLLAEWNAKVKEWYEADDLLGINQRSDTILASFDKDLRMIPGKHYTWERRGRTKNGDEWIKEAEFFEVTELEGIKHFYKQMLIGDKTDNVIGIAGLGQVKSAKLIDPCVDEQEMFDVVYNLYNDPLRFASNAMCLWIMREEGETWAHHFLKTQLTCPNHLKPVVEALCVSTKSFMAIM